MNRILKKNKAILRRFMREHYSDARLVQLLDHARSGKLAYYSCCCFIGVVTATHELREEYAANEGTFGEHIRVARELSGANAAEGSFLTLGQCGLRSGDDIRRRILIPMILAELRRRASSAVQPLRAAEEIVCN